MTQLDNELEEANLEYFTRRNSEGSADADDEAEGNGCVGIDDPVDLSMFAADSNPFAEDMPDLDELVEAVQGLPAEDAIEEIRDSLKKSGREVSDADVLGVLLRVFRTARNNALEGYDPWETPVEYCEHLTKLCDRNFLRNRSPEDGDSKDLPASVVAAVYAECGRTMLVADELAKARDMLEKANNVFGVIPTETATDRAQAIQRQAAAARASYARVVRRLAGASESLAHYLRALKDFAVLQVHDELADFLSEYCEVLSDVAKQGEEPSPGTLSLLADIAEEKFGAGSEEHLDVLRHLADACVDANRTDLAAPALAARARLLRAMCTPGGGMWAAAEAEAAEEEAAAACEAAVPRRLEVEDLDGAAAAWEEALHFREAVQGTDSQLVCEMRATLTALRMAIVARGAQAARSDDNSNSIPAAEQTVTRTSWDDEEIEQTATRTSWDDEEIEDEEEIEKTVTRTSWDDEEIEAEVAATAGTAESPCTAGRDADSAAAKAQENKPPQISRGAGSGKSGVPSGGLRPAWAKPPAAAAAAAAAASAAAQPSGDGWDD